MPPSQGYRDQVGALSAFVLIGQLGLVVAVPVVAGAFVGRLLDAWAGTKGVFVLGLLLLGLAGGLLAAWRIIRREIEPPGGGGKG